MTKDETWLQNVKILFQKNRKEKKSSKITYIRHTCTIMSNHDKVHQNCVRCNPFSVALDTPLNTYHDFILSFT
jgi:hypothetical protein